MRALDIGGGLFLVRKIALGGTSEVFLAQAKGKEKLAVKLLLPHLAGDEKFRTMFYDEIRLLRYLKHPNIVAYKSDGEYNGRPYLALEWVDGCSLAQILQPSSKPIPYFVLYHIFYSTLKALEYAHFMSDENGVLLNIVHRDIAPGNILVARSGEVKISDFGIASALHKHAVTITGEVKGRFEFIAPEQLSGASGIDSRSDLFSLGRTMLSALGRSDEVPAGFKEVLNSLCVPDKERRPENAGAVMNALNRVKPRPSLALMKSFAKEWCAAAVVSREGVALEKATPVL